MPVKKRISSEPQWDITPSKNRSLSPPKDGATITLNSRDDKGVIRANINFGERTAMLFRGKCLRFSSEGLPEKLFFKVDTVGYKATSTKDVRVTIPLKKEIEEDFIKLWAHRAYTIKTEKDYYYFELSNDLDDLFDDPIPVIPKPSPYPKLIASAPSGIAYLPKDMKSAWDEMAKTYVQTVAGGGENGVWNKRHVARLMKLTLEYGYATVNVPIITEDGTKAVATMLYNGTGRWE